MYYVALDRIAALTGAACSVTGWRQHHPFWLPMLDALSFAAIAAASRIDRWFEAHDSQGGRA